MPVPLAPLTAAELLRRCDLELALSGARVAVSLHAQGIQAHRDQWAAAERHAARAIDYRHAYEVRTRAGGPD